MATGLCDIFRQNVRDRMVRLDLTQVELAKRMHITQGQVAQYLNGYRTPGLEVLDNFAKALDITPDCLIRRRAK